MTGPVKQKVRMMTLLHLILVSIIQGITEFLPISSSAHLILLPSLTGIQDQGQLIDVAVHFGTLFAVVLYFWSDVRMALIGTGGLARGRIDGRNERLALCLVIATIPAIVFGLFLKVSGWNDAMRGNVALIGWTMLVFGVVLYVIDRRAIEQKTIENWSFKRAFVLGLWQAVALIPGTSRSGITITGARAMGFTRIEAARISMLMSIPTIIAASVLLMLDVISDANFTGLLDAGIAAVFAAISAYIALAVMMRFIERVSFTPYVIYRVVFGLGLIFWAYL